LQSYRGLIGRGGGFTPAGDDFVAGFVGTFNYIARCRRDRTISIPSRWVLSKTVPESGAILAYAAKGYVDEGLERLILSSTQGKGPGFSTELLSVASRGHTSGLDMSLGVLLCGATLVAKESHDGTLQRCAQVIGGGRRRTLYTVPG
jgi:hypothetical protein